MSTTREAPTIAALQQQVKQLESQLAAVREFREHLHYSWLGLYSVDSHYVNNLDAILAAPKSEAGNE